jgi:hypothetical protein
MAKPIPHKNTARHVVDVGGGRMLAPGDVADLDPDDDHVAALTDDGTIRPVTISKKTTAAAGGKKEE